MNKYREERNYEEADRIRNILKNKNILVIQNNWDIMF